MSKSVLKGIVLVAACCLPVAACSSTKTTYVDVGANGKVTKGITADGAPTEHRWTAVEGYEVGQCTYVEGGVRKTFTAIADTPKKFNLYDRALIDTVRPISGTADNSIKFSDQVITEISTNVSDTTLSTVLTNLDEIKKFLERGGEQPVIIAPEAPCITSYAGMLIVDPATRELVMVDPLKMAGL